MNTLEQQFEEALLSRFARIQKECGIKTDRYEALIARFGALHAVRGWIRQPGTSDLLQKLADRKRIELSPEAAVVSQKFSALFTDEEVNQCFALLCEYRYF